MVMPGVKCVSSLSPPMLICHHDPIANHNTLEIYGCIILLPLLVGVDQGTGKVWDIHTAVRLSSNPEVIGKELWELLKPGFQSCHIIGSCPWFIVNILRIFVDWETHSWWSLEEEKISFLVPGVRVQVWAEVRRSRMHHIWTNLLGKTNEPRAAWTAIQPQYNIIVIRISSRCGKNIMGTYERRLWNVKIATE